MFTLKTICLILSSCLDFLRIMKMRSFPIFNMMIGYYLLFLQRKGQNITICGNIPVDDLFIAVYDLQFSSNQILNKHSGNKSKYHFISIFSASERSSTSDTLQLIFILFLTALMSTLLKGSPVPAKANEVNNNGIWLCEKNTLHYKELISHLTEICQENKARRQPIVKILRNRKQSHSFSPQLDLLPTSYLLLTLVLPQRSYCIFL